MAEATHPYDRHVGRYGSPLAKSLIEIAGIKQGDRALDVGCGTGQLTAKLAAVLGGENVAALDPSQEFVAVCRGRVPAADVRIGSAQALPFSDGEFDAVLAQLVIQLVADPPAAVREMARVTRPGAPVSACFWDDAEMPLLRSFWDAAGEAAPAALAGIEARTQVGLSDPALLEKWWAAAGLEGISRHQFEVSAHYESFEDLWRPFDSGVGESGRLYRSLDAGQRAATRADAHRRLGSPEGPFELGARVQAIRGISPAAPE